MTTELSNTQLYAKTKPPILVNLSLQSPEQYFAVYAYHYLRDTNIETISKRCDTRYYNEFLSSIVCSFIEQDRINFDTIEDTYNSMAYEMIRQTRIPLPLTDTDHVFVAKYSMGDDKSLLLRVSNAELFTSIWSQIDNLTDKDTICIQYI